MLSNTKVAGLKPPAKGQEEHADAKVTGLRLLGRIRARHEHQEDAP
jgi:hypothetical protein